jgi:hypothetical protein
MLTPYLLLARAPARFHLSDARDLLLRHSDGTPIPPRLTRPGLAGDLLQAFDRTVKLSRKLPRGPLGTIAGNRVESMMLEGQQEHGGWLGVRPTLLSLLALRVIGAGSDDPRLLRGLEYLRSARGVVRIDEGPHAGREVLAQGLSPPSMVVRSQLLAADDDASIEWLLAQEIEQPGPWRSGPGAARGGWPTEPLAMDHLDLDATCSALEVLLDVPAESRHTRAVWEAIRRSKAVLLSMQEPDGSFSRFQRGETTVLMRRFPWRDADLLGFDQIDGEPRVRRSARAVALLVAAGLQPGDARIRRAVAWLVAREREDLSTLGIDTLAALARCASAIQGDDDGLGGHVERHMRARQQEDGSFGSVVDTSTALATLLGLCGPCVQTARAARFLAQTVDQDPAADDASLTQGLGLSPLCFDVSAAAREARLALLAFVEAGGSLSAPVA